MGRFTPIDQGGYAKVHFTNYKGEECVRKVLHEELLNDDIVRKRFLREYNILKEINHPNIIKVHEVQDAGSYIMEKADTNLEEYICNNNLSNSKIDKIIDGIISGVSELHSKDIVHRDLKPDNILMINDIPKIADLGVCKPLNSDTILTRTINREKMGSLNYMSNSHHNGKEPTFHFDIFAIGRIIYFMETKKHPSIGRLSLSENSLRYKALILATESENPIKIQNIEELKKLRKRIFNNIYSAETSINKFIEEKISISELAVAIEKSTQHDNFELLDDNFDMINENIPKFDNAAIESFFNAYIEEFAEYTNQRYWPFSKMNNVARNLLKLHEKCSDDTLKKEIFIEVFYVSYRANQWDAMDILDDYIKSRGEKFYTDCFQILISEEINQDLLDSFVERNG